MKMSYKLIAFLSAAALAFSSCSGFLEVPSKTVLSERDVDEYPELSESLVLSYYPYLRRYLQTMGLERNTFMYFLYDGWFEDLTVNVNWSGNGSKDWPIGYAESQMFEVSPYNYEESYDGFYQSWDSYLIINKINHILADVDSDNDSAELKASMGELYFIRAFLYFELVKKFGGVPLFDEPFDGQPTNVRQSEEASWEFVLSDLDKAIEYLPETCLKPGEDRDRANRYTALALKSRVALYAASIARYGTKLNVLQGVPESRAQAWFKESAEAAQAVLESGKYALADADDFAHLFDGTDKDNGEIIFRFSTKPKTVGMWVWFDAYYVVGRATMASGAFMVPTLNAVEQFETLDGQIRPIDESRQYESQASIYAGRDRRLEATILHGGSDFLDLNLDIYYAVDLHDASGKVTRYKWNNSSDWSNRLKVPGYDNINRSGVDGCFEQENGTAGTTNTGFFIRKNLYGEKVDNYYEGLTAQDAVVLRLGEVVLNFAEAAAELASSSDASYLPEAQKWFDKLRAEHGGLPAKPLDIESTRHERRVELMFENHRYWDLKRWHTGHLNDGMVGMALHPILNIDASETPARFYYTVERADGHELAGNEVHYFSERDYYCPVPIDQHPGLKQNVGWEGVPTSIYDHPSWW